MEDKPEKPKSKDEQCIDWRQGLHETVSNLKCKDRETPRRKKPPKPVMEIRERPLMKFAGALAKNFLFDPSTKIRDIGLCRPVKPRREILREEKSLDVRYRFHVGCRESDENFHPFPSVPNLSHSSTGRWGLAEFERKLDDRLQGRIKDINRMARFDALMRSDGSFKRQVWAGMMREGIIGYNKTQKKGINHLTARDKEGFIELLKKRYGSILCAWRNALDVDRNGRISFFEFCRAARSIGYEASLRHLWNEINSNDDPAFITLDELDKPMYLRFNEFKDRLIATFGSIEKGWKKFDAECRRQIYWNDFRRGVDHFEDFTWSEEQIKQLFSDLDVDGGGFISRDEWFYLDKWKSAKDAERCSLFRKKLKVKYTKARDAYRVFCPSGSDKISLEEFKKNIKPFGFTSTDAVSIFQMLDTNSSGFLSLSEFVKLYCVESIEMTVCPISSFDPLPILAREISVQFGFDLSGALKAIAPSVRKSYQCYAKVIEDIMSWESAAFETLVKYEPNFPQLDDDELQPHRSDMGTLLRNAAEVQRQMKLKIAPNAVWPVKTATRNTVPWVHEAYDPGIKSRERIMDKAKFKYKRFGDARLGRVRDVARLALQYDTCQGLLEGLAALQKEFKVVMIDNRFKNPTPLGWRDISCIVKVDLAAPNVDSHYAEIQLHHTMLAEARTRAHTYYATIRKLIPQAIPPDTGGDDGGGNVSTNNETVAGEIQAFILNFLASTHQCAFRNAGNVLSDMERSKVWTKPWKDNETVQLQGEDKFPPKRPPLTVGSSRCGWMHEDMNKPSAAPLVPDLRHNKPWAPVSTKKYFSTCSNDVDEDRAYNVREERSVEMPDVKDERRKKVKGKPNLSPRRIRDKIPTPRLHCHRPRFVEGCISSDNLGIPELG